LKSITSWTSGILTLGGIVHVPDHISNEELLCIFSWPEYRKVKPNWEARDNLSYRKDNYWVEKNCSSIQKI
jgi:hypothetical protein